MRSVVVSWAVKGVVSVAGALGRLAAAVHRPSVCSSLLDLVANTLMSRLPGKGRSRDDSGRACRASEILQEKEQVIGIGWRRNEIEVLVKGPCVVVFRVNG